MAYEYVERKTQDMYKKHFISSKDSIFNTDDIKLKMTNIPKWIREGIEGFPAGLIPKIESSQVNFRDGSPAYITIVLYFETEDGMWNYTMRILIFPAGTIQIEYYTNCITNYKTLGLPLFADGFVTRTLAWNTLEGKLRNHFQNHMTIED